MRPAAMLVLVASVLSLSTCLAQQTPQPAQAEEPPYDERGFIRDNINLSLSFTSGSTQRFDYEDLRIYLSGNAHYAFVGDDYLNWYLLINRQDRSYDDPRFRDEPISNIFNTDFTYVFNGIDRETRGLRCVAGVTLFSDSMFEDVELGLGPGVSYTYESGDLQLLGGLSRNTGYEDSWSPLLDLGWAHNQRLGGRWQLRTKADLIWTEGREAIGDEPADPDTVYLLDGQLSYEVVKGWSVYVRYFNDNSSDFARSYWSMGLSHYYRKPRPRR
ncbi:MAG: hypothetical protein AB7Y46_09420 [Armatimonadota bacterium]